MFCNMLTRVVIYFITKLFTSKFYGQETNTSYKKAGYIINKLIFFRQWQNVSENINFLKYEYRMKTNKLLFFQSNLVTTAWPEI